jgi:4-hydroxybenzoate polyprenyltransferase
MFHLIKLTRPVNLLVIALTMYVLHTLLLKMHWNTAQVNPFADPLFALLVLSTVLIAAAGNIINDYFDVKIDRINKPEKLIVDRYVKRRKAILVHTVLNFIAVLMALIILFYRHNFWPLVFHLFTTFSLWMYSMVLKRKFLIGNVVIGMLTAMVPLLVYLYHRRMLLDEPAAAHEYSFHVMAYFALFAFCTTLIREIQKDFADMKGDALYGCKTVPLYLGIKKGRMILFAVFVVTIGLFIGLFFWKASMNQLNIAFFTVILLLFIYSFIQSASAIKRAAWLRAAMVMKLVMIAALLFFAFKIYA